MSGALCEEVSGFGVGVIFTDADEFRLFYVLI